MHPKDVLGRKGEQLAAEYLVKAGFRILDRNFCCAEGEIDIVATDRRELVACEVKTRSDVRYGTSADAVTRQKLRRLRHLAAVWASSHGWFFDQLRVDVIGVLKSPSGEFTIKHLCGVG
jgi:putative endonuclease